MKYVFLPDENVLMRALKCNKLAREFWQKVASNKHIIAIDGEWTGKYWQRIKKEKNSVKSHFPNIPNILNMLLRNPKTCDFRANTQSVKEEIYIRHPADKYLLRIIAANAIGGILVTTDRQTRTDFNRPQITSKYNTQGITIEKALELAREK